MARPTAHFEPNQGQVKGRTEWTAQAGKWSLRLHHRTRSSFRPRQRQRPHALRRRVPQAKGLGNRPSRRLLKLLPGQDRKSLVHRHPALQLRAIHKHLPRYRHRPPTARTATWNTTSCLLPEPTQTRSNSPSTRDVHISKDGDLILAGLRQHRPRVIQDGHEVASAYELSGARRVHI